MRCKIPAVIIKLLYLNGFYAKKTIGAFYFMSLIIQVHSYYYINNRLELLTRKRFRNNIRRPIFSF